MDNQLATTDQPTFVKPKVSALAVMATRLNMDTGTLLKTLKDTVFKGASDSELAALTIVANEYGLNPFVKELYAFPAKGGGIVPVVSVDGWIALLNRQEKYDGIDFEFHDTPDGKPLSCMAVIHIKGRSRPVAVQEFYSECYRNTDPWNKSPRRMLRHRALMQCARVAFGFSGVTDEDEARTSGQIDEARLDSAKPVFSTQHKLPAPTAEVDPAPTTASQPETPKAKGPKSKPAPVAQPVPEPQTAAEGLAAYPAPVTEAITRGDAPPFDLENATPESLSETPAAGDEADDLNPIGVLKTYMANDDISESELTTWARGKKMLALNMVLRDLTDQRATLIINGWENTKKQIVEGRGPK